MRILYVTILSALILFFIPLSTVYAEQELSNKEKYTTQQLQRMRDEVMLKDAVVRLMEIPLDAKDGKNVVPAMRAHIDITIKINPELGMQLRNFCNSVNCYQIANDKQRIAAIIYELKKKYAQYELILSPETAEQEKAAQEKAAQEKEKVAKERLLLEKAAQEKAAQEKAAQEKAAQEKAAQEKEKVAKERLLLEKAAQEKAAQEMAAQAKVVQERLLLEKAAQDKRARQDLFAKIISVVLIFALLFFLHRRETRLDSDIMHNILRADKPGLSIVRLFMSKEKRREKHEKFSSKYLEKLRSTLAEMFVIASSATQKAHDEDMELIEAKKREIEKEQNAIEILNARIEEEKLIFKDLKSRHSFLEGMVKNR